MNDTRSPARDARASIGRIEAVEALRGVAMLCVVLFHYLAVRDPRAADPWTALADDTDPLKIALRNGNLGVDLFFLISGFLLVLPWALEHHAGTPRPATADFYARRARRILPAYYAQLAVVFGLMLPLVYGIGFIRDQGGLIAYNVAAHAVLMHYTTPLSSASLNLNGALWTLTIEAQFYLLLPLLAPWFVRRPALACAAMIAIAASWRAAAESGMGPLVAAMMALGAPWEVREGPVRQLLLTQLPGYLGHFAAGMALGIAWLRWRDRASPALARHAALVLGVSAGGLLYGWLGFGAADRSGPMATWIVALLTITAMMTAAVSGAFGRVLANAAMLRLGRVSYSAYLYHVPLLLVLNRVAALERSWLALPVYLLALGCVAAASWRWIERPLLRASPSPRL
jgi:peptidoglycan/LPS O-acetylase OafA/YrhL